MCQLQTWANCPFYPLGKIILGLLGVRKGELTDLKDFCYFLVLIFAFFAVKFS